MDLLRTQGSFALSIRYAICMTLSSSIVEADPAVSYPIMKEYEEIAKTFENALNDQLATATGKGKNGLDDISSSEEMRADLTALVVEALRKNIDVVPTTSPSALGDSRHRGASSAFARLAKFVSSDVEDSDLSNFVRATINAFFDNDLLHSVRLFLQDAKGSFGLMVASSIDAHRQVCFAARGQTASIAFYPRKGIICYGSEQAAVKAGLNYENPGGDLVNDNNEEAENAVRLDLDDLGGEICLLDWGFGLDANPCISPPNRGFAVERLMNVNVVLLHQSQTSRALRKRLTLLENNEFMTPLLDDCSDPVLADIKDIPRVCKQIQDDWREVGLNR